MILQIHDGKAHSILGPMCPYNNFRHTYSLSIWMLRIDDALVVSSVAAHTLLDRTFEKEAHSHRSHIVRDSERDTSVGIGSDHRRVSLIRLCFPMASI